MRRILIILAVTAAIGAGYFAYRYSYVPPYPCQEGETVGICLVHELQRIKSQNATTILTVRATAQYGDKPAMQALAGSLDSHYRDYDDEKWQRYHRRLYGAMLDAALGNITQSVATVKEMAVDLSLPRTSTRMTQKRVAEILLAQGRVEDAARFLEGAQDASFVPVGEEHIIQDFLTLRDSPVPLVYGAFRLAGNEALAEKFLATIKPQSALLAQIGDTDVRRYYEAHKKDVQQDLDRLRDKPRHEVPAEVISWALAGETDKVLGYVQSLNSAGNKKYLATQGIIRELIYQRSQNISVFKALWPGHMGVCLRQGVATCFGRPDPDMFIRESRYGDCLQYMFFRDNPFTF